MGNETSQLAGLEIDEKAVEVTDFWTHHSAVLHGENVTPLSVFIGEPLVGGALWINQTPLEKATKNLMLHRHPCILKYISSWNKGSKLYLAVEYVKPLAHVISNQTTLQICIGLHSILKALAFLHEKALASHNNVCSACVYVTQDGSWKLGGLEYLCRFQDLSLDYLNKTRAHRYEKAIDPGEDKTSRHEENFKNGFIDKYAFAVLVDEVLRNKNNNDIQCLEEFRLFCKNELQNQTAATRPSLGAVLKHEFFTHNFIVIYSFLTELPLKSEGDKEPFFTGLAAKLRAFPEEIVARQLGELLLSRLVLLDRTAQAMLLPFILAPKQENSDEDDHIFSESTFKQIIVPKLLHIFRVRDAQIRLLLLSHFKHFVAYFNNEQLQNHILPELLIGIKDTNDHLVSVTLMALSALVPILGAATVIGGKRAKLFNDGRPAAHCTKKQARRSSRRNSGVPAPGLHVLEQTNELSDSGTMSSPALYLNQMLELPERPSPDGGEGEVSTTELDQSAEDDLENWSDWDVNDTNQSVQLTNIHTVGTNEEPMNQLHATDAAFEMNSSSDISVHSNQNIVTITNSVPKTVSNAKLPDISELDIKNQRNNQKERNDDFDFFQDMEPVIEMTNRVLIDDDHSSASEQNYDNKGSNLNIRINNESHEAEAEEGWGDDLDWVAN